MVLCPNVFASQGPSTKSTKKVSHLYKEGICHHIPQHSSVKDSPFCLSHKLDHIGPHGDSDDDDGGAGGGRIRKGDWGLNPD